MKVTFTRTGERRYSISVEGAGIEPLLMEPAPGYDPRLPHDMAHFVVENTVKIQGGVFGQLAAGGNAGGSFRPKDDPANRKHKKRGDRIATVNRDDAILSEKVVHLACSTWNRNLSTIGAVEGIVSSDDIRKICVEFDVVSAIWSRLGVGESMTLVWQGGAGKKTARRHKERRHTTRHGNVR